jgi:hypothetical protein
MPSMEPCIETGNYYVWTGAEVFRFQLEPYPLEFSRLPPRLVGLDEAGAFSELGVRSPLDAASLVLAPLE